MQDPIYLSPAKPVRHRVLDPAAVDCYPRAHVAQVRQEQQPDGEHAVVENRWLHLAPAGNEHDEERPERQCVGVSVYPKRERARQTADRQHAHGERTVVGRAVEREAGEEVQERQDADDGVWKSHVFFSVAKAGSNFLNCKATFVAEHCLGHMREERVVLDDGGCSWDNRTDKLHASSF